MSDDKNLRKLAEAAQAKMDRPIDWNALVEAAVRDLARMNRYIEALHGGADVWKHYVEALGSTELTAAEKRQAVLDTVLEQSE